VGTCQAIYVRAGRQIVVLPAVEEGWARLVPVLGETT
jgi:hypothetical protein